MKIALFCLNETYSTNGKTNFEDQIALVRYVEQLGFDEAWFGEHHFNGFSILPDPAAMIAYTAAVTDKIRLGTAGFLAPFYNPVRLAESICMLDRLSNGRIDAGFAKGGFVADNKHFEKNEEDLREMLFEHTEAVDELVHKERVTWNGNHFTCNDVLVQPKSLQSRIPFYIATFSNSDTITFAAQHGYGLMFSQGATLQECRNAQEVYKSISGFYPQTVLLRVFCVADSTQQAQRIARPSVDHFIKSMRAASAQTMQPVWDKENYDRLLKERESFFDGKKFLENAVLGTPKECIAQVKKIKEEVKNVHLTLKPASAYFEENKVMLARFATQIKPKI
jgi:alkanesulfonate monooxygenase SsuD/methylene tetrahydromethanopterin reductase-like flavin-dependent oxidoreductase (luciferase family)